MYDMSSKFRKFYESCVVLPRDKQNELYEKKDINVSRLKDGLDEYNKENGTSYSIIETYVQGSVAMSTVVQNEGNNYDIDVAVVLDGKAIENNGALATRKIVAEALRRKTKQFNTIPEVKTSCVRVQYADGYHIDFAVYRRSWNCSKNCWEYEHAGPDWSVRDVNGLKEWFEKENKYSGDRLRQVVRLSKMFCNSRENWLMPSGLLQTVLCAERLKAGYTRIDELFYYTMREIVNRLEANLSVNAPVDNGRNLTLRQTDIKKMTNWKNRLKSKLEDLEILFMGECSETDALQAWFGFFNHNFWLDQNINGLKTTSLSNTKNTSVCSYRDTEQFIEDIFPVNIQYQCKVSCYVKGDGWKDTPLNQFLGMFKRFIPHHFGIKCEVTFTDCPGQYSVYWKVKNVGPEAERKDCIRGQIEERGRTICESTSFFGNHFIECYIIQNDICVARTKIDVPIGRG